MEGSRNLWKLLNCFRSIRKLWDCLEIFGEF